MRPNKCHENREIFPQIRLVSGVSLPENGKLSVDSSICRQPFCQKASCPTFQSILLRESYILSFKQINVCRTLIAMVWEELMKNNCAEKNCALSEKLELLSLWPREMLSAKNNLLDVHLHLSKLTSTKTPRNSQQNQGFKVKENHSRCVTFLKPCRQSFFYTWHTSSN